MIEPEDRSGWRKGMTFYFVQAIHAYYHGNDIIAERYIEKAMDMHAEWRLDKMFNCPKCGSGINHAHGYGERQCGKCGTKFRCPGD